VSRHPYPPHDFECLYRHTCPYLDGLSTTWVLGEYRRAAEVYQEHLRIIDGFDDDLKTREDRIRVLERENAELKAKLQALHRRQFKPNRKRDTDNGGNDIGSASSSNEGEKKKRLLSRICARISLLKRDKCSIIRHMSAFSPSLSIPWYSKGAIMGCGRCGKLGHHASLPARVFQVPVGKPKAFP